MALVTGFQEAVPKGRELRGHTVKSPFRISEWALLFIAIAFSGIDVRLGVLVIIPIALKFLFFRELLKLVAIFFLTLPFYDFLVVSGISVLSVLSIIVVVGLIYFETLRLDLLNSILLFAFVLIAVSFCQAASDKEAALRMAPYILVVVSIRSYMYNRDVWPVVYVFVIGACLGTVCGVMFGRHEFAWLGSTEGLRLIGCVADPNYFCRVNLFAIAALLAMARLDWWKALILHGILTFGIMQSGSKMGLALALVIYGWHFISLARANGPWRLILGGCALIAMTFSGTLQKFAYEAVPALKRLAMGTYGGVSGLTTGRLDLQLHALEKLVATENWGTLLFGFGFRTSRTLTQDLNSHVEANVLHSIPVECLVEFGALGLIYIFLLFAIIFLKTPSTGRYLLLAYIVTSFALSGLFYWDLIFFYSMCTYVDKQRAARGLLNSIE